MLNYWAARRRLTQCIRNDDGGGFKGNLDKVAVISDTLPLNEAAFAGPNALSDQWGKLSLAASAKAMAKQRRSASVAPHFAMLFEQSFSEPQSGVRQ